jgi:hypothetical protein
VIEPTQKVGESRGSTSIDNNWLVNCALLGYTDVSITVENHFIKESGVGSQSRGIDFEALPINLVTF